MFYRSTLNLPTTRFPMRARLTRQEPGIIEFWEEKDIYHKVLEKRRGRKKFILHDGPPYSNGSIHIAHAINKILKDIVIKSKNLMGYQSIYIPGWDNHGLPNEIKAVKTFKLNRAKTDEKELRKKCRESALHFVKIQKDQFKRLGVFGDWEHPYLTLHPCYESTVIKVFRELVKKGLVYRGKKPVHWCPHCETALAEAELEYKNRKSPYIFVKFPLKSKNDLFPDFHHPLFLLTWSLQPWTLAGNAGIAVNPDEIYCLVKVDDKGLIMAESLTDFVMDFCKQGEFEIIESFPGKKLQNLHVDHPILNRKSKVLLEESINLDQGIGCVHIAPGHDREDFNIALKNRLEIPVVIDEKGILNSQGGNFQGIPFEEADSKIIEELEKRDLLFYNNEVEHSYPHCWHCHSPIIFRAAKQWFVAIDNENLRDKCLKEIDLVNWYPDWGRDRIYNMVKARPDWCISRQRAWGIPIPVFYCSKCDAAIVDDKIMKGIEELIGEEGSDAWFTDKIFQLIPDGYKCPECGEEKLIKKTEIFDVWFESGVSYEAILYRNSEVEFPADMYLEGNDQHRGWFQTSLIPSTALKGRAPYREVITQGWVLDENGKTMHKSLNNVLYPEIIINRYGAEILRLYAAKADWTCDVKVGLDILEQLTTLYRKIRNTLRFLIANLFDFDPKENIIDYDQLPDLERWIIHRKEKLVEEVRILYSRYKFHQVFHIINQFCVNELSKVYFEIAKDALYCDEPDAKSRRSIQSAFFEILRDLTLALSPILSFTAEEVWRHYRPFSEISPSVFLAEWDTENKNRALLGKVEENTFDILLELREEVYSEIEKMREQCELKDHSKCRVEIFTRGKVLKVIERDRELFRKMLRVVNLEVFDDSTPTPSNAFYSETYPGTSFIIRRFTSEKCERCRNNFVRLNSNGLCARCENVMEQRASKGLPGIPVT